MKTLQDRLKFARKEAFLTQAQLSHRSGLSQSTIAQIESGRNSGTRFADRLAEALGVSVSWLLTGQGEASSVPLGMHPRRRAMDADEWLFLDLDEPSLDKETGEVTWSCLERGGLRIHRSFFRGKAAQPESCRVMVHHGTTMQPFLYDGDWYVVNTAETGFLNGMMAFIRDDGEHYVARVQKRPDGGIRLSDGNSVEPPFDFAPGAAETTLRVLGMIIFHTSPPTYQYQLR